MDFKLHRIRHALLLVVMVFIFTGCGNGGGTALFSLFGASGATVFIDGGENWDDEKDNHVIPEPGTMALLGTGLAAMYFIKKEEE